MLNETQRELLLTVMDAETLGRLEDFHAYSLPAAAMLFDNSDHLMRKVTSSGSTFFGRDTMRRFRSKINELVGGRFLVMSDLSPDGRVYHVLYVYEYQDAERLQCERLGWFMGSGALVKARKLAKALAEAFPQEGGDA